MHLSNKQRVMNKTYTVLSNKYCSSYVDTDQQDQMHSIMENTGRLLSPLDESRFSTFTKYKIKQPASTIIVNEQQQRYFDSPTMIVPDDDDEYIPISRCSNKTSSALIESNLDETELSDLLIFTNPNRLLSESMRVVASRHPSLQDLKYINDVSSRLGDSSLLVKEKEEPVYQELIRIERLITPPLTDHINDVDENKENRPPLMPIKCPVSRIPVWIPSSISKTKKHEDIKKKSTTKPCLVDILDQWSSMTPKLKDLLTDTRKMPIRMPQLTKNSSEFRRLKQLLNDLEITTSSWTNAINQCRYVLQHAQQQFHRG
ncbi:unnamed protein product [Adineta ricciae]|uniref:Uncharacterized protein n=1 Tax=Adineta ricciae TaxID=249248 RepID=A0A814HV85_ADIRI|nr:unnamed protein product [Adineta ricciae]CAF1015015.1 unnamed protein product [Adineta ricciae]